MDNIELFLTVYMLELEKHLNAHKDELINISFQSDEANTDRPLKEYLKETIQKCNKISSNVEEVFFNYDLGKQSTHFIVADDIKNIFIEKVLLPDELSSIEKQELSKRKNAVYTNPDICLKIIDNDKTYYETIELKSTKKDNIPGSSIQQISPDEWVIFIKHSKNTISVITGKYIHSINSKMQFPDRSPRPQVSFRELEKWNHSHRKQIKDIIYYCSDSEEKAKYELLSDWQAILAKRWKETLFSPRKKKNEPWFNNNLRKFILDFLAEYDKLSEAEKDDFKSMVKSQIE